MLPIIIVIIVIIVITFILLFTTMIIKKFYGSDTSIIIEDDNKIELIDKLQDIFMENMFVENNNKLEYNEKNLFIPNIPDIIVNNFKQKNKDLTFDLKIEILNIMIEMNKIIHLKKDYDETFINDLLKCLINRLQRKQHIKIIRYPIDFNFKFDVEVEDQTTAYPYKKFLDKLTIEDLKQPEILNYPILNELEKEFRNVYDMYYFDLSKLLTDKYSAIINKYLEEYGEIRIKKIISLIEKTIYLIPYNKRYIYKYPFFINTLIEVLTISVLKDENKNIDVIKFIGNGEFNAVFEIMINNHINILRLSFKKPTSSIHPIDLIEVLNKIYNVKNVDKYIVRIFDSSIKYKHNYDDKKNTYWWFLSEKLETIQSKRYDIVLNHFSEFIDNIYNLIKFLEDNNICFIDWHNGNFGFDKDYNFKILDLESLKKGKYDMKHEALKLIQNIIYGVISDQNQYFDDNELNMVDNKFNDSVKLLYVLKEKYNLKINCDLNEINEKIKKYFYQI